MISLTCVAPVNIAVVKYWGKRDDQLILPINDSISGTLSTDQIHAIMTIAASPTFSENKFWLNGEETSFEDNSRLQTCINLLKDLATKKNPHNELLNYKLHICSKNNFPTACGLASSAAGYACLVYTLANLYGIDDADLTTIARQGSGSACRSIYGGFVHWIKGEQPTGEDSKAVQLADEVHWPEIHVLVLVVNDTKKKVNSTRGMANSVKTSDLLKYRVEKCVGKRIEAMKKAIGKKNFKQFAELTMKDSNQFHAVCQDTYPPCVYMNDTSHRIAQFVHKYNQTIKSVKVAYTFDAGPNACIYIQESEVSNFISTLNIVFPSDNASKSLYIRGIPVKYLTLSNEAMLEITKVPFEKNLLKYIIHTKLGGGPRKLDPTETLLDESGLPKDLVQ